LLWPCVVDLLEDTRRGRTLALVRATAGGGAREAGEERAKGVASYNAYAYLLVDCVPFAGEKGL